MKRLYLLSALMLIMAVTMLPQNTKAQAPVWDGTWETWTQGSGTQADPYLIETPQHLAWLARQVNNGVSMYNGVYFRLTNDLDLNSEEWTPIGNSITNRFKGIFDGDNHFVDNISIMSYTQNGTYINPYSGLFGVIDNATIMNIGTNTNMGCYASCTPIYVGGIAAYAYGGTNHLINCYQTGNINFSCSFPSTHKGARGGIVGFVDGETILSNCRNYGQVRDRNTFADYLGCHIGGLIGLVNATVTISDCSNYGIVNSNISTYSYAGGLIGHCQAGITTIINSHNEGNVTGYLCGGLIGRSLGTINTSNCYNEGELVGITTGGLVGYSGSSLSVTNSYNIGSLSCNNAYSGFSQGGLVGESNSNVTVSHSCNKGTISVSLSYNGSSSNLVKCGGLIGYNHAAANISHSFNTGCVSLNSSGNFSLYSGGIVGYSENNSMIVEQCYNTGLISSTTTSGTTTGYSGGIIGYINGATNIIEECYNVGNVTGSRSSGGILGYNKGSTSIANCYNVGSLTTSNIVGGIYCYETNYQPIASNCYYLNTCGGSTNTGCESLTSAQMKSSSFPGMLNVGVQAYTMDGNPNVNQGYPIFGDMVYAVTTQNATNVGVTRATLHGNYVGGADMVGFQYRENTTGSAWNTVYATVGSPVSYLLTGLQSNTGYVFRFMVENNGGVYYGEEKTFTTGTCNLTASVSPSSVTICQGETTTVTASGQSSLGNQFSYSWNTGETTATISVFGGGERIVTVSDSNGCTATASVNVTVNPLPAVAISGNTTLCVGESSLLTASGGSSYVWNTGASTPSITVSNGGTYSVTASNSYGCSSSASVQVISLENVSISGNLNICQGQSTTLYANGTGSYHWSTGANTSSISVTQEGLYTVTVSLGNCSSSASALVSIAANPIPSISGNTTICQGETSLLIANGGNSYVWSNGSASNSIGVSQSGTYSVTATSMEGCTGSTSVFVTVNPLPNVNISGNNSFCQGSSVVLTASGASSYSWSNGSSNATITVSNPGTYTLIGTDANNCANTATKTVMANPTYNVPITYSICQGETYNFNGQYLTAAGTYTQNLSTVNGCDSIITLTLTVKALPTPTISGNTVICQGQSTTLTANGGTSYVWSNASTNSSITVNQSGVYTVTATNAEGCSNTANVTVAVNPLPNVNISGNSSFCQGDDVTLTATGANTYVWNNASTNASITVSNAGNYTVTGTDGNGCSNTATKAVSVNPTYNTPLTHSICEGESYNFYGQNITTAGTYTHTLQTVNGCDSVLTLTVTLKALPPTAITGNTTLCEGENTTLTANGGATYVWSNAATTNSINVSQSGVYTVTATNAEGCSNTANVTVMVNPLPTITIGGNTTVCAGSSTTLTASGANTYSWSTGDNTAAVTINAFGVYTVTGTSTEGCSNTTSVTVLVSQLPVITITGETDICAGESTTLMVNGGETYLWSDGTTSNTVTVSMAGTYQVIGYNAAGCNSMASATVNVWQPTTSEFSVECPDSCYTWNGQDYCTSGEYTQTFQTVHGCDSVVTMHLTITVGIDDYNLGASMTVYPNPTTSVVNVQCTMNNVHEGTVEFQLFDAFGRLLRKTDGVETQNFASLQTARIDLSHYAVGVYFIKAVADGNVVAVRKVVKR